MYFLGIDSSTASTGYCVMNKRKEIITKGKIVLPDLPEGEKILFQIKELEEIIEKYPPVFVLCEDQFGGPSVNTLKKLSRVLGAILCLTASKGVPTETAFPASWRKVFHGYGKASKKDTFNKVVNVFELNDLKFTKDNDITDAIGIASACVDIYQERAS